MKPNTIVFDFDGTLADTFQLAIECMNELSEEYGYKKIKDISKVRDKSAREIIQKELGLSLYKFPSYLKKAKPLMHSKIEKASLFKDMKRILLELSKHFRIGILTSNSSENVNRVLGREGIEFVDFIFSGSSTFGKHRLINEFLKKNSLKKREVVYVGDEVRDIQACKKVKIRIIAVSWGYNSRKLLLKENPDMLIDRPRDLLSVLNEL